MGQARYKWMKRAMIYDEILRKQGLEAAREYLERFGGKLEKFMKGMSELNDEIEDLVEGGEDSGDSGAGGAL